MLQVLDLFMDGKKHTDVCGQGLARFSELVPEKKKKAGMKMARRRKTGVACLAIDEAHSMCAVAKLQHLYALVHIMISMDVQHLTLCSPTPQMDHSSFSLLLNIKFGYLYN